MLDLKQLRSEIRVALDAKSDDDLRLWHNSYLVRRYLGLQGCREILLPKHALDFAMVSYCHFTNEAAEQLTVQSGQKSISSEDYALAA